MNDRVGRSDKLSVLVLAQAETLLGQLASEYAYARTQGILKPPRIQVELQRVPQTVPRFLRIAGSDEHVQRLGMVRQQVRRNMGTDVTGAASQEDGHCLGYQVVAEDVPAAPRALASVWGANGTLRRGLVSGGRPSIRG